MDPVQICEIKYSFASDFTSDKMSEENSLLKEEIKSPEKELSSKTKKSPNFLVSPFTAVDQCTSVTKSCMYVNRKLGYLTPKLSVWFPKILNTTQWTET